MLYNGYRGVKTGITKEAGPCVVEYFEDKDSSYIIVLLNCRSVEHRWQDASRLLEWIKLWSTLYSLELWWCHICIVNYFSMASPYWEYSLWTTYSCTSWISTWTKPMILRCSGCSCPYTTKNMSINTCMWLHWLYWLKHTSKSSHHCSQYQQSDDSLNYWWYSTHHRYSSMKSRFKMVQIIL